MAPKKGKKAAGKKGGDDDEDDPSAQKDVLEAQLMALRQRIVYE